MADALQLSRDDELLELGCGSAGFLAGQAGSAHRVAGIDLSDLRSGWPASGGRAGASSKSQARKTKRGNCTAATDWKLKAKPCDGRLEVEFEVDSNVTGQRWTYTLRHDGTVKASGARTTKSPSGSFSVEKRLPNAAGVHTISATSKNASTGETCTASLVI